MRLIAHKIQVEYSSTLIIMDILFLILNFPRGSLATTKSGKIDESFQQS